MDQLPTNSKPNRKSSIECRNSVSCNEDNCPFNHNKKESSPPDRSRTNYYYSVLSLETIHQ